MCVTDRSARVSAVVESLEREMELLCVTGVEDKLQDKVRPTLESLRNAGIKVTCPGLGISIYCRYCIHNLYICTRFGC